MVAGDAHDPVSGRRLRRAVDAQLRRAGVAAQDAGDVRTEVVLALLSAPAAELPLPLELVCARVSAIARNKAIDRVRRRARAPLALGDDLPEPPQPARDPGSLADGLDEVAAAAHLRRVRADLALALERLDAPQRAAIAAHAEGGAARAAGLPRSTYYRALGHAQALLQQRSARPPRRSRRARRHRARAREVFAHVEAAHAAAAAATAAVAISAAVALSVHDEAAHHSAPTAPVRVMQASGGRVPAAATPLRPRARAPRRVTVVARDRPRRVDPPARPPAKPCPTSSSYDPSTYDC